MNLKIDASTSGNIATLLLMGSVASSLEAVELRERISAAVSDGATWVVLDCTGLTFMNSTGLGIVVASFTSLKNRGGGLCLAQVNGNVEETLKASLLNRVLPLYATVAEAVAAYSAQKP